MKKYILFFAVFAFIFSSCLVEEGQSSSGGPSSPRASSNGIEISFVDGAPPNSIYVEGGVNNNVNFEVVVDIRNRGSYPRNELGSLNGRLYLSGFDQNIIRNGVWNDGNQFNKLEGVSSTFPDGGFMQKSFVASDIYYPFDSREYPLDLLLTACYYYETEATGIACVDPSPGSPGDKVCRLGIVNLDPQRAPVKVTRVEQTGDSRNLYVTIDIANRGSGTVLREFLTDGGGVVSDNQCLGNLQGKTDFVGVKATIVGVGDGNCKPSGSSQDPVRLYNGQGRIYCTFPLPQDVTSAYTTQMKITLQYGYLETVRNRISLVNTAAR